MHVVIWRNTIKKELKIESNWPRVLFLSFARHGSSLSLSLTLSFSHQTLDPSEVVPLSLFGHDTKNTLVDFFFCKCGSTSNTATVRLFKYRLFSHLSLKLTQLNSCDPRNNNVVDKGHSPNPDPETTSPVLMTARGRPWVKCIQRSSQELDQMRNVVVFVSSNQPNCQIRQPSCFGAFFRKYPHLHYSCTPTIVRLRLVKDCVLLIFRPPT